MKIVTNKLVLLGIMAVMIAILYFFFSLNSTSQMTKSFSMGAMVIEEKHHHIERGEYIEMWVVGYNVYEDEENRERYKIYIEESMVYNLIKEGEEYFVSATSFREDGKYGYAYQLEQISNQEEYQLTGKGRIK